MMSPAKAIVGGVLAAATAIVAPTVGHPWSWWSILPAFIAGVATFSGVYWTPNAIGKT